MKILNYTVWVRSISLANPPYGRKPILNGKVILTPPGIMSGA